MSSNLSDFTSSSPSNVARTSLYSDLDLGFIIHPTTGDVSPVLDILAVQNAVKNLVLSNFYEPPFDPFRGGNLVGLLFEPVDSFTALALKKEITRVLNDHEPRINALNVQVVDNSENNEYDVTISFNVIALSQGGTVNFYLERLR